MSVSVGAQDFKAVAIAQAEELVTLKAVAQAMRRELVALEEEHAKCPKPEKEIPNDHHS